MTEPPAVPIHDRCGKPWPECTCGRPTTDADRRRLESERMVRAFPIIDRSAALSAVLALFSEANEERRRRHPEAVEAILAKAAEYGVKRPTQLRKRG